MAGAALSTLPGLGAAAPSAAAPARAPLAAPAKAATFGDPTFQGVWNRTDKPVADRHALVVLGPAPATGAKPIGTRRGGSRLVQYFDKSRMEINNPAGDPNSPFFVTNGLLAVEMISGRMQIGDSTYETAQPRRHQRRGDCDDPTPRPIAASGAWQHLAGRPQAPDRTGQKATATIDRAGTVGQRPGQERTTRTSTMSTTRPPPTTTSRAPSGTS